MDNDRLPESEETGGLCDECRQRPATHFLEAFDSDDDAESVQLCSECFEAQLLSGEMEELDDLQNARCDVCEAPARSMQQSGTPDGQLLYFCETCEPLYHEELQRGLSGMTRESMPNEEAELAAIRTLESNSLELARQRRMREETPESRN